ncbi:MAG: hypothetical protein BMS9Abin05_0171 [Rhodothermia bacterium]|nr:MAG: hypothetical protein BMS9Abin05_0171 [Rhodothermia bacterium]
MSKEIIINAQPEQTRIAIVENGDLAELFIETEDYERTIGNLFLGKVRRVMPSIQAAFVDIGQKQDAFLHFSDLIDSLPDWLEFIKQDQPNVGTFKTKYSHQISKKGRHHPRRDSGNQNFSDGADTEYEIEEVGNAGKGGAKEHSHITDRLSRGQRQLDQHQQAKKASGTRDSGRSSDRTNGATGNPNPVKFLRKDQPILVRISKEPIQSKGSRVTTDISLAGRFLVLVPMANYVAVSKKIMSFKERRRLRALAKSLLPEGFGVIVRTVASGHNAKALDTDLRLLVEKWRKVEQRLASHRRPPTVIHEDVNMASSIIRDFFSEDFDRILIDSSRLYRNIKGYIQAVAPKMAPKVRQHTARQPIFKAVNIDKAVDQAFESRVELPSGGYLFIEHTEAMHVVDVNSGRAGRGLSQEENSLKVNLEAVKIIAQQVRLRDLGGILVVDFIDMRQERNRRKVHDLLRREFRKDRAVTKVLPMSDFGLIQITRQRLRPSITATFSLEEATDTKDGSRERESGRRQEVRQKHGPPIEPEDVIGKIEDWLVAYRESDRSGPVKLIVHPFTAAYLNRKFPAQATRWSLRHKIRISVESDVRMDPLGFRFFDGKTGKEISSRPNRQKRNPRRNRGKKNVGDRKQNQ